MQKGYVYPHAVEPDVAKVVVAAEFEMDIALTFIEEHLEDTSA